MDFRNEELSEDQLDKIIGGVTQGGSGSTTSSFSGSSTGSYQVAGPQAGGSATQPKSPSSPPSNPKQDPNYQGL